jgi:hypothetical protein
MYECSTTRHSIRYFQNGLFSSGLRFLEGMIGFVTETVLEGFYLLTCGRNSHLPLGNCRPCRQN